MTFRTLVGILIAIVGPGIATRAADGNWRETRWNDERAFIATAGSWEAVVSVDRGRLVYLGKLDGAENLLYAPTKRDDAGGWGGHLLWLGPQAKWERNWPPPAAWEASAAKSAIVVEDQLELTMPDAGHDWPQLVRAYRWFESRLHIEARISGGERDAQIIHIIQVPATAVVELNASPTAEVPRGYVQVHLGRVPSPVTVFDEPAHVSQTGSKVTLKYVNRMEKFGFVPQPIIARNGGTTLRIERGRSEGPFVGAVPDDGFVTQIYLGSGRSPLIELEQLSPLWAAANTAVFEIILAPSAQ